MWVTGPITVLFISSIKPITIDSMQSTRIGMMCAYCRQYIILYYLLTARLSMLSVCVPRPFTSSTEKILLLYKQVVVLLFSLACYLVISRHSFQVQPWLLNNAVFVLRWKRKRAGVHIDSGPGQAVKPLGRTGHSGRWI